MELILEKLQLSLLQDLQRNTSDRATYQKLTTLLMIHQKYPFPEIAFILGIDTSTVYRHYHQYIQSKNFDDYLATHYKPCQGKLTHEQNEQVHAYVGANICHTSLQVLNFIKDKFGVIYKPDSVIVLLHRLGFVYKKTKLIPSKADLAQQELFIEEFRKKEQNLSSDELILFGDGVHPRRNRSVEPYQIYLCLDKAGTRKRSPF